MFRLGMAKDVRRGGGFGQDLGNECFQFIVQDLCGVMSEH